MYAGTGPFATLALCILNKLDPNTAKFTLLDYNQASLGVFKRLVTNLGLHKHFSIPGHDQYIQADATEFVSPKKYHIIITETMHSALTEEPQAAITANLKQYLLEGGVFLPESIVLNIDAQSPGEAGYHPISEICRVDMDICLTDLDVHRTVDVSEGINALRLSTHVQVFGPHVLLPERSKITSSIPVSLRGITLPTQLIVQHRLGGPRPQLNFQNP